MKKHDFYYDLPENLIAQTPIEPRDHSRMMVVDRKSGRIEHKHFYDFVDYLNEGDCLVLNDTRVMPARIYGVKKDTGAVVEFLLLTQRENDVWEVIAGPGKKAREGAQFIFNDGLLECKVLEVLENGNRIVKFSYDASNIFEVLDIIGEMPLPHYIKERLENKERYQTVYSKELGSAAAPTAGLHFTDEIIEKIKAKGVKIAFVTLHVGIGTFRPVKTENIEDHVMHSEHYTLSKETADIINETKKNGKRVIAVGTTSCRTLESVATYCGEIKEDDRWTSIFIYPGYEFKCVDALLTNFHLPESTLIMLVSAFYNREKVLEAYNEAVKEKYRFFSFGDCSFFI
ncbi:MAG: tRNA preQ1(34) S-adenosylmethionine ribosyltransferase-isomerase QueA [Ruminococcaceae bacterium]|jgi:S-adenosylmethionine:tRNA ribosyltransferase-isomerase|nr:tRNA preQ1(34) S-adenosylmethionine ribosyltransferase-isomerase QueA [Oscillospiraceae bacterium]